MNARRDEEMVEVSLAPPAPMRPALTTPPRDDSRLVLGIAGGDRDAFETLYRRYVRPVYALALRRLGDRHGAEEAVQETFTAVWRSARSFRPERGDVSSWLYAIARNATVDRFRARPEPVAEPPDTATDEPGPGELAESDWLAWRVHYAVAELPEREREVIELAYWSGLSQSEVAERLRLPLGTVKTRTRSALSRLAAELDAEELR